MRRWLLVLLAAVPVAVYGTLIALAYRNPPLATSGWTVGYATAERGPLVGIDLSNRGRWPIALIAAQMAQTEEVSAWITLLQPGANGVWMAGNMAVAPEEHRANQHYRKEPLAGFRVEPDCQCPQDAYGLRFDLKKGTPPGKHAAVIHYRYLGWTFTLRQEIEISERPGGS